MTRVEAIAEVKAKYPDAYHAGHGTINQIQSHSNYKRRLAGLPEEPVIPLSDNLVISASFDQEIIEYLDTALWIQAVATCRTKYDMSQYYSGRRP